jgi:putative hydrolase of the HAD superfamily
LLVLDLDDTLYPEREYVRSGFAAVDRWLQRELRMTGFLDEANAAFEAGVRGNTFDIVLSRLGASATPELIGELVAVYRSHEPGIALHDDAAWCLERFAGTYDLGLLTDGYLSAQQAKVRALGIEQRFQAIVYSDELGRESWKPSRRPFEEMMARTGYPGISCLYVSDNPAKDFVAANGLGWTTIRIRRPDGVYAALEPGPGYEPRAEIASLYDLASAIDAARSNGAPARLEGATS